MLWERLHLAHAPSCQEQPVSLHGKAIDCLVKQMGESCFQLISLGCGLAEKESHFLQHAGNRLLKVGLVDGSGELVCEAKRRLNRRQPNLDIDATVADLSQIAEWSELIPDDTRGVRVISLFGMMPNFAPGFLFPKLSAMCQEGDWLLVDSNLIPGEVDDADLVPESIQRQYDNDECRQWLMASLAELGVYENSGRLMFTVDTTDGELVLPRIRADFKFDVDVATAIAGEELIFRKGERLSVFYSIRYCHEMLPVILKTAGLVAVESWCSESGEDGVYLCRRTV